jgi:hypothetical protein
MKNLIPFRDGNVCGIAAGIYLACKILEKNTEPLFLFNVLKNKKLVISFVFGIIIQLLTLTRAYRMICKKPLLPFFAGMLTGMYPGFFLCYSAVLLLLKFAHKMDDNGDKTEKFILQLHQFFKLPYDMII